MAYRNRNPLVTSPEITGLLRNDESSYRLNFRSAHDELEVEQSSKFAAKIIESLDSSRNLIISRWRGGIELEETPYLQLEYDYDAVEKADELPARASIQTGESYEDPYEVLAEPIKVSIEGNPALHESALEDII